MDRKQLNRDKILVCSKDIIESEGIHNLTILNIVKKCNISKRTFYEIFPSKKILINELKQGGNGLQIIDEREDIIKKARESFSKKGYNRIDMDEIAKAAGIRRTTLYKYFKSKEELLEYCVKYETEMIKRVAGKTLLNIENPAEVLEKYITGFCKYIEKPYPSTLFSEAYNYNKKIDGYSKDLHHFFVNSLINVLESGVKKGIFHRDLDVEGIAVVVLAALSGLDYFSKINPSLDINGRIKNNVLALLFNTILIKQES
ncbi:TetR/AcrR family transcriptional regulator [Desulfosporosinus fructosivorans]|uniref:TetR/AcrR family transcriptional regulator n=1 Tax=Desulfosporosinus fructosivorans TaxID=2018669 RepID=A0A4Z0R8S2_9FIRM|nr:TetR/AcrR family transcriptional regulator [Desulfosporosinus fructosivorans]TGE39522.1 TetR/AcrR family transcriptional regulator [Desulfosporosinus fructosivorans]